MSKIKQFITSEAEIGHSRVADPQTVLFFKQRRAIVQDELRRIDEMIDGYQSICTHEYRSVSLTPHYELEKCRFCLKTRKI